MIKIIIPGLFYQGVLINRGPFNKNQACYA